MKERVLLGQDQIAWVESQIRNEKEVIIGSGMALVDTQVKLESLQRDSPKEWEVFRNVFKNSTVKAVFLTGDVHFSEVREVSKEIFGYKTFQLVSSPMHSTPAWSTPPFRTGYQPKNKKQLQWVGGNNFALLSMDTLFETLNVKFVRTKGKPPIDFSASFENSCQRFYQKRAAGF